MTDEGALERRSTGDHVREVLTDRILDGTYGPGDRIVESRVARELETSQAPVREALRELQGLGLVTVRPYRGARVREVTREEMDEALEVRALLEAFAARQAAAGVAERTGELRRALEGMRAAAADDDADGFVAADVAFHRVIVSSADHGILCRTWESLGVEVRIRMLLRRGRVDLGAVAEAHAPILEALARGDGEAAGRLLRAHPRAVHEIAGVGWGA